jgi:hypothetical protein
MRGRTLNDAFVILDEAQNTTIEQMKMFLTRIGFGSTAVVTGDMTQTDLPKHVKSGLRDATVERAARRVRPAGGHQLHLLHQLRDVVRHPTGGAPHRRAAYEAREFLFYKFYKQLYYFKVRVSADATSMPGDAFLAFADTAARTLVPAIQAVNIGDCANATITIPAGGSAEDGARALVREATLQQGYNCHADRDAAKLDALARDAEVVEIGYRAEEWKSR